MAESTVNTGIGAFSPSLEEWGLDRLRRLVSENDLERGRIEYKRELGNGRTALEAIAALANSFGGVVLVGVDEAKQGPDRIVGVDAGERDRLVSLCWSQLVPPFSPDIIPIKLDEPGRFVFAVIVDSDYVRRPVMLTQGNKVLVRLEDKNVAPDWYRLRDLFLEQPVGTSRIGVPAGLGSMYMPGRGESAADVCLRGRLWLGGPRGQSRHITEAARLALLALLNADDACFTGTSSAIGVFMHSWAGPEWKSREWELEGLASTQVLNARWHGLAPGGQTLAEARLTIELTRNPAQGDSLIIQIDLLLTNPRRASQGDKAAELFDDPGLSGALAVLPPEVFVDLGTVGKFILGILSVLWGPLGAQASTSVLSQPLGAPAQFAIAVSTVEPDKPSSIPINAYVDFGVAHLIPGNTPRPYTEFGPIQPDRSLLNAANREQMVRLWLTQLCVDSGYQNVEQELVRHVLAE
jgi:Putative DNA-binding domain